VALKRKKANGMVDPRGWFPGTKKAVHEDDAYIAQTLAARDSFEKLVASAEAYVLANFTPKGFMRSEVFKELDMKDSANDEIHGHEHLSSDDIGSALRFYLQEFIETHFIHDGIAYTADLAGLTRHFLAPTIQYLQSKGYNIQQSIDMFKLNPQDDAL
jgi:hypothetical protein